MSIKRKINLTHGISKKEKSKRGKYLSKRINELYKNLSEWIDVTKDYKIKKYTVSVEGEKLPALDISSGKKLVVSLKPTGLYAFGVNSQINITSEKETNILYDISAESASPDWQLVSSEAGKKPKKLTKVIFRNLLKRATT